MKLLDLTLPTPAENLALDEALLEAAEAGLGGETLRFWESGQVFAVLGYSRKAAEDIHLEACKRGGIPVLRRPSGGGTVLQGPGCLNFALILDMARTEGLQTIRGTNEWVLTRMADALAGEVPGAVWRGISDLAVGQRKFSGTAQRRKRSHLLFHGTILYDFDLTLVEKFLAQPQIKDEPDYRNSRKHLDFLTQLPLPADKIKALIRRAWNADTPASYADADRVAGLVQTRYARTDWNLKY